MRSRRLAVLSALAAALLAGAGASAAPTIQPQTQQCDGTWGNGGATHRPDPALQVLVQDTSGLRIGQASMGATVTGQTLALWRFNSGVTVADGGCASNLHTFVYNYDDPDQSSTMIVGQCVYNTAASCGAIVSSNTAQGQIPLGLSACPATAPSVGPVSIFQSGGAFGGSDDYAPFDGSAVHFGSVTFVNSTLMDRPATYTLSAWIKSGSSATQRVISEQDATDWWGFGINDTSKGTVGLRFFDSRNQNATIGDKRDSIIADASIDDNNWHKIDVVRINGSQERFYDDGNLIGTIPAASTDSFLNRPIGSPIVIGKLQNGGESFNGQIDEIRVTDAPLSDEDIRLEYLGSNLHQYAGLPASPYGVVTGGFSGGVTNGDQNAEIYTPSESPLTTANAPDQRWIFEAQSTETVTTVVSSFTVVIDTRVPTAPTFLTGTPSATNAITWTWSTPSRFCQVASPSLNYHLFDAVNGGAQLNPPGNISSGQTSTLEGSLAGPNQLYARRLNMSDVWGTGPLTASASAYTMAADPVSLAATPATISSGGFVVTWGTAGNPSYTRYELTYSSDVNFAVGVATRIALTDNFTGTTSNLTGLPAGTTIYARVRAYNGRSTDTYGGVPSAGFAYLNGGAGVVTVPPAPLITGTPVSNSQIQWNWTSASGANGYTLYDTPTQAVLFSGAALSFTSATLTANTRYDAEVEADLPSPSPASPRGHAFAYTWANPPAATAVSAVYATSATFSWSANGNPSYTFYQVVVATDPAFGVVTATLTVSAPTATATGLLPGVTYYSEVQAINGGQITAPLNSYVAIPSTYTLPDPSITVNSSPASPYVAPIGLVGAWQFDENTGTTTADASGQGNTGDFVCTLPSSVCTSTPTWTSGPVGLGSAASFSGGQGGRVLSNSGAPFNFTDGVTIEAWVNPSTPNQTWGAGIVGSGKAGTENFAIDVSSHESFEFLTSNGVSEYKLTVPTATIVAGRWTHVVGVYYFALTSTSTLYLDGVPVAVASVSGTRSNVYSQLAIGNRQDASGNYTLPFSGGIDSVRVIHAALTPAQVLADYQGGFISSVTPASPNNGIIVGLPPNAFGAPARIFISADPVNHPIRVSPAALSAGLQVTPSGLTMVPNSLVEVVPVVGGLPFTTPLGSSATLTIPYKDPQGTGLISGTNPPLTAARIQMYTLNTAVNAWTLLPTVVDRTSRSASGSTPHFSVFALFAPATVGTSLAAVKVYPVPWKPGSGGRFDAPGVTFADLPASGTVRILTLAGRRVRDFGFNGLSAGSAVWDGRNDDGRRAASGVYFARVTSGVDGSSTLLKFAIER